VAHLTAVYADIGLPYNFLASVAENRAVMCELAHTAKNNLRLNSPSYITW